MLPLVTTIHGYKMEDDKAGRTKDISASACPCFECGLKSQPTLLLWFLLLHFIVCIPDCRSAGQHAAFVCWLLWERRDVLRNKRRVGSIGEFMDSCTPNGHIQFSWGFQGTRMWEYLFGNTFLSHRSFDVFPVWTGTEDHFFFYQSLSMSVHPGTGMDVDQHIGSPIHLQMRRSWVMLDTRYLLLLGTSWTWEAVLGKWTNMHH